MTSRNLSRSISTVDFAHRLRRIIAARGITPAEVQRQLHEMGLVSLTSQTVWHWCWGRQKPRSHRLAGLAKVLEVNENVLTGDHTLRFDGCVGGFSASCDFCMTVYHLEGSRHTVPELDRFELMHWGIAT